VEKSAKFFSTGKLGKGFPLSFLDPAVPREQTRSLYKYWIMTGIRADTEGVPWGVLVRANRYLGGALAPDMLFAVTGLSTPKRGKYRGTVLERRFMVPSSHCAWRVQKSTLGLCGQGSC
jgi:hypothetical protein